MISAEQRNGIKNFVLDGIVTDIIDSYIANQNYSITDNDGKKLMLEDIDALNKYNIDALNKIQLTYKDVLAIQAIVKEVTIVANLEEENTLKGIAPIQSYDVNGIDGDKAVLKYHLLNPSKYVKGALDFNLTNTELKPVFIEIIDELIYEITNVKKEVVQAESEKFQKRMTLIDFITSVRNRLEAEEGGKLCAKYRSLSNILKRLEAEPYLDNLEEAIQETGRAVMKHRSDPYTIRGFFSRLFINPTSYSDFIKIFGEVKQEEPKAEATLT